jgi:hypothetical protein
MNATAPAPKSVSIYHLLDSVVYLSPSYSKSFCLYRPLGADTLLWAQQTKECITWAKKPKAMMTKQTASTMSAMRIACR